MGWEPLVVARGHTIIVEVTSPEQTERQTLVEVGEGEINKFQVEQEVQV